MADEKKLRQILTDDKFGYFTTIKGFFQSFSLWQCVLFIGRNLNPLKTVVAETYLFWGGGGEALFQCSFILFLFLAFLFVCLSVFYLVWLVGLFLDGIVHACSFRDSWQQALGLPTAINSYPSPPLPSKKIACWRVNSSIV